MESFFNDKQFRKFLDEFFSLPTFTYDIKSDSDEVDGWTKESYISEDGDFKFFKFYKNTSNQKSETLKLKSELQKYVESQDFENAVILRDQIKKIENNSEIISKLESELKESIQIQNFEKSIELRDKINKLKSK
jgi:protein-arginine kinase activator protein McsA